MLKYDINVFYNSFFVLGPGPGSWAQECKKNEKDTLKYNMKYDKLNQIYAKIH